MNIFFPEQGFNPLATRVGWALLHSLWQGVIVAVLSGVGLRALRRHAAATRHAACLLALGLLTISTGATLLRTQHGVFVAGVASGQTGPENGGQNLQRTKQAGATGMTLRAQPGGAATMRTATPPVPAGETLPSWRARLEAGLPRVAFGWALGVLLLSLRHTGGWWRVQALRGGGVPGSPEIGEIFGDVCRRYGVNTRAVRLLESAAAGVPMLTGLVRPVVLLPARAVTGLSAAQLEAVLAHELAHLVRKDAWTNLALVAVETVFFYHPAVWWIGRRAREEREIAADDLALSVCKDRREYAGALAQLAEFAQDAPVFALAATGSGGPGSLLHRIRRIVQPSAASAPSTPGAWGLVLPVVLMAAALGLVQIAPGQADEPPMVSPTSIPAAQPTILPEKTTEATSAQAHAAQAAVAAKVEESRRAAEASKVAVGFPGHTASGEAPAVTAQELDDVRVARLLSVNRQAARTRGAEDRQTYTPEQLQEIETLYQVANNKGLHDTDARASLKQLLDKYDRANRTGCATLYYGQGSRGAERVEYLTRAVEKFSDCYYFDGCQVGGYGRVVLAMTLWDNGQQDKARAVLAELRTTYKDATDHHGRPMSEAAAAIEQGFATVHP